MLPDTVTGRWRDAVRAGMCCTWRLHGPACSNTAISSSFACPEPTRSSAQHTIADFAVVPWPPEGLSELHPALGSTAYT